MYVADRKRTVMKSDITSLADWLAALEIKVCMEPITRLNLERVAQLFNRTNQMNLTTRRLTPGELEGWASSPDHWMHAFRVADRFGDYGLCGVAGLAIAGNEARITDFLLSCRVMGRGVESTMLRALAGAASEWGFSKFSAACIPTPKNQPCQRWFAEQANQDHDESFTFNTADLLSAGGLAQAVEGRV